MAHTHITFDHEFSHEPVWTRLLTWLLAGALTLFVILLLVGGTPTANAGGRGLFGYDEMRSTKLAPFAKWRGTLDRYFRERKLEGGSCESSSFNKCHLKDWKGFLGSIRGGGALTQLDAVNRYMNRAPYITDPVNYNMPDYWATPRQFFIKDGDCEDYAIAKYLSLRALGWPASKMRIVVLQDTNLRLAHAVLVVFHAGRTYVLDNQIRQLVTDDRIRHYRPIYSINESAWWLHRRPL